MKYYINLSDMGGNAEQEDLIAYGEFLEEEGLDVRYMKEDGDVYALRIEWDKDDYKEDDYWFRGPDFGELFEQWLESRA